MEGNNGSPTDVAWCDACDTTTERNDDGTCAPCESREPWLDGES